VLVIDDDDDVRHMTRIALGFEGFEVTEAPDGAAGLQAIRTARPDALVLDVMMPGLSGHEVLRVLRGDDTLADLPVVVLTADANRKAEQEGWDAGATAFVTKPFTGAALAGTLRGLLSGGHDAARGSALARRDLARRLSAAADGHGTPTQGR
jgi:DNA-binding response OmpR family regulator